MRNLIAVLGVILSAPMADAGTLATDAGAVRIERMIGGLVQPWAIGFLPGGGFLVTERGGRLLLVRGGRARAVAGLPDVYARGEAGLLGIAVARDFTTSREVFLTFANRQGRGADTALAVVRLSRDGTRLENLRVILQAGPGATNARHFGSRVIEARDGTLFMTTGDRGIGHSAQQLAGLDGKVLRIRRDGSVPEDNPFVGVAGARPEIWSLGHRNAQGTALDLQGNLWIVEHGAKGGDEVNRIRPGVNYGWPVISYGVHYNGARIGIGTSAPGMEQPMFYWDPSMAPSGLMIYSGRLWPEWRGDIFVGSLKFDMISHLRRAPMREIERISGPETDRVRDIIEAPDGSIWFISVGNGAVYRLTPG